MKKQTFVLWALTGMLAVPASAQVDYKTRAIVAEPENAPVAKRALARDAEGAEYSYPVGLRNLGMIGQDDNACCNFLSFNKVINRDAYMWAPMGETVSYIDNSSVQAVDYHWFIPGADATVGNTGCRCGLQYVRYLRFPDHDGEGRSRANLYLYGTR